MGLDGVIWGDWQGTGLGWRDGSASRFGGTGWRAVCRPTGFWSRLGGPVLRDDFGDRFFGAVFGGIESQGGGQFGCSKTRQS